MIRLRRRTKKIYLPLLVIVALIGLLLSSNAFEDAGEEESDIVVGDISDAPEETEEPSSETSEKEVVVLETSKGVIEVELDRENAPVTVANFVSYVNEGFFYGTVFHRVIPGFMVQGGGFLPDGTQKQPKAPIKLESNNGLKNVAGTIAMARTNVPDSATSQFFINTVDNSFLDYTPSNPGYAVFGKVILGMEVVKAIEAVTISAKGMHQDWPVEDILISKAYLKE